VSGKKLFKVGAVFDAKSRTLAGWKVAEAVEPLIPVVG
jgi:hypothetical protein